MSGKRLLELDGLRGVAALVVVFYHYLYAYNNYFDHTFSIPKIVGYGKFGVQLFFILSGFVIFWSLLRAKRPLDFVWSRFTRLYAVYWVCVITSFAVVSIFGIQGQESWETGFFEFLINLTMLHQFFGVQAVDLVYWTLSMELVFYFWMLTFFIFGLFKYLDAIMIVWVVGGAAVHLMDVTPTDLVKLCGMVQYIQYFALGIAFYKINHDQGSVSTYVLIWCCVLSILVQWPLTNFVFQMGLVIIFLMAVRGRLRILGTRFFVYFGEISYPLYLLHAFIGYVILNAFYSAGLNPWLGITVAFVVSVALATFYTYVIDKKAIRFLRDLYRDSDGLQKLADKCVLPWSGQARN